MSAIPRPTPGLRRRLMLYTLPGLALAFAAVWLLATAAARQGLRTQTDRNLELQAQNLAESVARELHDAWADVRATARLDLSAEALDSGDPKNLAWYADELVRSKPRYSALIAVDDSGRIAGANTRSRTAQVLTPPLRGVELPAEAWLQRAYTASRDSPVLIPRDRPAFLAAQLAPDESVVGFAAPVLDVMDERVGALAALVSTRELARTLQPQLEVVDGSIQAAALVLDGTGNAVLLPVGIPGESGWQVTTLAAERGAHTWDGADGTAFRVAAAPVGGVAAALGWRVVTLRTMASLEAPVRAITQRVAVTFAVAFALAALALALVAARLLGPIQRLTAAVTRTGRAGEFQALPVESTDEVGALTLGFNRMMGTIREFEQSLEALVTQRTAELAAAKQEVSDILDHMAQAIVTIGAGGVVNRQFSAHACEVFGPVEIAGRPMGELLQLRADLPVHQRTLRWLQQIVGVDQATWAARASEPTRELEYALPSATGPHPRFLELVYAPMFKDGVVARVMVVAKDVTPLRELAVQMARQEAAHRERLKRVTEAASLDPELFHTFLTESAELLERCRAAFQQLEAGHAVAAARLEFLRHLHTLKGNARVFQITSIQDEAHSLEEQLQRSSPDGDTRSAPLEVLRAGLLALDAGLQDLAAVGRTLAHTTAGDAPHPDRRALLDDVAALLKAGLSDPARTQALGARAAGAKLSLLEHALSGLQGTPWVEVALRATRALLKDVERLPQPAEFLAQASATWAQQAGGDRQAALVQVGRDHAVEAPGLLLTGLHALHADNALLNTAVDALLADTTALLQPNPARDALAPLFADCMNLLDELQLLTADPAWTGDRDENLPLLRLNARALVEAVERAGWPQLAHCARAVEQGLSGSHVDFQALLGNARRELLRLQALADVVRASTDLHVTLEQLGTGVAHLVAATAQRDEDEAHQLAELVARTAEAAGLLAVRDAVMLPDAGGTRLDALHHALADVRRMGTALGVAGGPRTTRLLRIPEPRVLAVRRALKDLVRAGVPVGPLARTVQALTLVRMADLFGRFRRATLELARELGRQVEDLHTDGDDLYVDARLLDRLGEVLLHALRNALDHGIETPGERQACGKPLRGSVRVSAAWRGVNLEVVVADDGRGVDVERVRRRAVEAGLVDGGAAAALDEAALHELVFSPGFTTAREVTSVSGRGVGLDVIRSTLRSLRGNAVLTSRAGAGSTLTLCLPADYQRGL